MVLVAPAASYHHHRAAAAAAAAAEPVFPLLGTGQCALDADTAKSSGAAAGAPPGSAIHFWQSQPTTAAGAGGSADKKPLPMLDYGGIGPGGSGAATCHDCGNQAKKDCVHHRCRTCCKSRGFDCPTHVRSTWVPAARRRERQQLAGAASSPPTSSAFPATTTASAKKPRLLGSQTTTTTSRTSTSNATTPRSFDTSSSHQVASFRDALPRHVRAPAVFRCVRVTSVDDGDDEFAYQAAVTINGHMFRGFLYDQGADDGRGGGMASTSNDESSHAAAAAAAAAVPSISDLHLGSASAEVPPHLYSGGSGGPLILGGLGYGNTMN